MTVHLQEKNCAIFQEQGKLLDTVASKTVKVLLYQITILCFGCVS